MRVGDWKLVRKGGQGAWELYNLKTDRTELHNLAADQPAKLKALASKWEAWAKRAQVLPGPARFAGNADAAPGTNSAPIEKPQTR